MELQSEWWKSPLVEDIIRSFREKEEQLPPLHQQSPQLPFRRHLVDWLAGIFEKLRINTAAKHLAILLMDYFMDQHDIPATKLHLVALGCLLVAVKFEDQEACVPKWNVLNEHVPGREYTCGEYLTTELVILQSFKWHLYHPTAGQFAEYFLIKSLFPRDVHRGCPLAPTALKVTQPYMIQHVDYFLEISLQDYLYRNYKPSQVAAACVAASRTCLCIEPIWHTELEAHTGYKWSDLERIVATMLLTYNEDSQKAKHKDTTDMNHNYAGFPTPENTPTRDSSKKGSNEEREKKPSKQKRRSCKTKLLVDTSSVAVQLASSLLTPPQHKLPALSY